MASDEGSTVELYIYDLSHGIASLLSPAILGHQIEGIWHTAVVVYGHEYFFGSGGISSCAPGSTALGAPHRVEQLGHTFIPFPVFLDYVQGLATTRFAGTEYNLLEHNCNNFSDELAQFLCGARVPKHILELPARALTPALSAALNAALKHLAPSDSAQPVYAAGVRHSRCDSPDYLTLNDQVEQARAVSAALGASRSSLADKLARRERRKEKKRLKQQGSEPLAPDMAEAVEQEPAALAAGPSEPSGPSGPSGSTEPSPGASSRSSDFEERRREEELRREKDPPLIFREIDGAEEWARLAEALGGGGGGEGLGELNAYLVGGEGSWALGDDFMLWAGGILRSDNAAARAALLRCLSCAALRDDVALLLHQDRREHQLANYAYHIDTLPLDEQRALALLWCNLFAGVSASEWLLYISEWDHDRTALSNIRVTTKVAVHSLLSDDELLRDIGSALMYNIAIKEVKTVVFDDVSVELAMALLQFVGGGAAAAREEHLYRSTRALARLSAHSSHVPQLLQILAVQPDAYRGASPRVDEQIDLIMTKVK